MKTKIAFLDMEGTLLRKSYHLDNGKVAPSAWTLIAEILGPNCLREEEETKDRWLAGEYAGYVEWMKASVKIHKKYQLTKEILDEMVCNAEILPGAHELVEFFKKHGYVIALITGGFKALADKVQINLKIDHALSGCEYFFNENGEIEHFNLLPSDEEGKVDFMRLIAKEHGSDVSDCVFVGDGKNDCALAKEVGLSIAFNAQEELKQVSEIIVDQESGKENLAEIIEKVLQHKEKFIE